MEICIGDYVRTFNGLIGKVVELTDSGNYAIRIYNGAEYVVRAVIKNHSKNIIDVIKAGDYVNGILIEDIEEIDNKKVFYSNGGMIAWTNRDKGIETILTKEQYMQNCYKVERNEEC